MLVKYNRQENYNLGTVSEVMRTGVILPGNTPAYPIINPIGHNFIQMKRS